MQAKLGNFHILFTPWCPLVLFCFYWGKGYEHYVHNSWGLNLESTSTLDHATTRNAYWPINQVIGFSQCLKTRKVKWNPANFMKLNLLRWIKGCITRIFRSLFCIIVAFSIVISIFKGPSYHIKFLDDQGGRKLRNVIGEVTQPALAVE